MFSWLVSGRLQPGFNPRRPCPSAAAAELENVARKALLAARGYAIMLVDLREVMRQPKSESTPERQTLGEYAAQLLAAAQSGEGENVYGEFHAAAERELFSQAMRLAGGNKTKAARWLGIARLTLREKLLQLGLHPRPEQEDQ